jgi:hypothetical protein
MNFQPGLKLKVIRGDAGGAYKVSAAPICGDNASQQQPAARMSRFINCKNPSLENGVARS